MGSVSEIIMVLPLSEIMFTYAAFAFTITEKGKHDEKS